MQFTLCSCPSFSRGTVLFCNLHVVAVTMTSYDFLPWGKTQSRKDSFISAKGILTKGIGSWMGIWEAWSLFLALLAILFIALNNAFFTAACPILYLHSLFSLKTLKVNDVLHVCTPVSMLEPLFLSGLLGANLRNNNNNDDEDDDDDNNKVIIIIISKRIGKDNTWQQSLQMIAYGSCCSGNTREEGFLGLTGECKNVKECTRVHSLSHTANV